MESWLPIKNYEGLYEVSNYGRVKTLHSRFKNKTFLKPCVNSRGYMIVTLCKDKKQTSFNIHRLVAETFIPNPDNLPCINHKDENKANNNVDNLEWCSYQYNNTYGDRLIHTLNRRGVPVVCVETGDVYPSIVSASKSIEVERHKIADCCNDNSKTIKGLHWRYLDKTNIGTSEPLFHES